MNLYCLRHTFINSTMEFGLVIQVCGEHDQTMADVKMMIALTMNPLRLIFSSAGAFSFIILMVFTRVGT